MQSESDLQRQIVGLLLTDRNFLSQNMELLQPKYFQNRAHRIIASAAIEYFQKYKCPITQPAMREQLKSRRKDEEDGLRLAHEYFASRDAFHPGVDSREYLQDLVLSFAKREAIRLAITKIMDELKRNMSDEVFDRIGMIMDDARSVDLKRDSGLDYFITLDERYERMKEQARTVDVFTTGFPGLDNSLTEGGIKRGELYSVMALPGVGKSLCLTKMAVANVMRDRFVLYISTEMDEDGIAKRFDSQFAVMDIRDLMKNPPVVISEIESIVSHHDNRNRLKIKQFPPKSANIDTFRGYISQLEMDEGFRPDLIILDYVGECKPFPELKTHESMERITSEFRGLCVELHAGGATAMQPNRGARDIQKGGVIDDNNLGDAYGQSRPLDGLWSLNQTDEEKQANVARLFIIKLRAGVSRVMIYLEFDPKTLEYREISTAQYRGRMQERDIQSAGSVQIDDTSIAGKSGKKKSESIEDRVSTFFDES